MASKQQLVAFVGVFLAITLWSTWEVHRGDDLRRMTVRISTPPRAIRASTPERQARYEGAVPSSQQHPRPYHAGVKPSASRDRPDRPKAVASTRPGSVDNALARARVASAASRQKAAAVAEDNAHAAATNARVSSSIKAVVPAGMDKVKREDQWSLAGWGESDKGDDLSAVEGDGEEGEAAGAGGDEAGGAAAEKAAGGGGGAAEGGKAGAKAAPKRGGRGSSRGGGGRRRKSGDSEDEDMFAGPSPYVGMYNDGFTGSFVMNRIKYRNYTLGAPVRIAKYKMQCLGPKPPRGCDTKAAALEVPQGRGWDRVWRVTNPWLNMLPEHDMIGKDRKWESCAVVGNGGSLLLQTKGDEIDRHEAVIRFNGGIVKGFEDYVGQRTTLRLANSQHLGFHEFEEETIMQHVTMEASMRAVIKYKQQFPYTAMYITDGDFHQYVLDTVGDGAASNGFYGMVLAIERCKRATLYGFYKDWASLEGAKYHYYDDVEPNDSQKRRDDTETPRFLSFINKFGDFFTFGEADIGIGGGRRLQGERFQLNH